MSAPLDPRVTPARTDLADEVLRGRVEAARFVPARQARIIAPSAPLRRRPAPDAPLDTEALMGEAVRLYDDRDGYAWIQLVADGYVGYLLSSVLGSAAPSPTHTIRALRTFVYPEPDLKRPPLAFLSHGAGVTPSGPAVGAYLPIETGGYVVATHLAPAGETTSDYVAVAETFLGTPYLWGGKTSLGLDCSGLVQVALAAAGIAAPRDSDMQAVALGVPLAAETPLQRGDLVFWGGHVGIMLDAERLLHANGHHMAVAIEPLAVAERRIRGTSYGPITGLRRLAEGPRSTDGLRPRS